MGLISGLLGLAPAIRETAEVFVENKTARAAQEHAEHIASLDQFGAEFVPARIGWFDWLIDGLNRMPRPAMALGTLGLFVYAMADPVSFGVRMQGLALVPDPLWWLLGAIVSFYFGARELHHFRGSATQATPGRVADVVRNMRAVQALAPGPGDPATTDPNPALEEWRETGA